MMDYRPTTRYISRSMAAEDPYGRGPTLVDGLEVVEEQVVMLSPLDVEAPRRSRRHPQRRARLEDRNGLG